MPCRSYAYIVSSLKERECCNVKVNKNMTGTMMWMSGLVVLLLFLISVKRELDAAQNSLGDVVKQGIAKEFCDSIYENFVPTFAFVQEKQSEANWLLESQMTNMMPIYGYTLEQCKETLQEDDFLALDEILLAEAQEGTMPDEDGAESNGTGMQEMPVISELSGTNAASSETQGMSLEELLKAENEAAMQAAEALKQQKTFVPHSVQAQVNLGEMQNYENLVQSFYTIDANTMAGSDQLNVDKLLGYDVGISKDGKGPQILIYHTHSQEAFADSVAGDVSTTIVGVGDRLTKILTDTYGYQVLHHTGQYDVDSRDDAYSVSLPAIEQLLKENPTIQVVIDLHRDQMPEETRLVMDLDGRPTARFMFFNGLSRTRKTGNISYLYNENQEENLAFSFQMQLKAAQYYPGLTRKIYLKGYRYNMHLKPRTLLVELGAQNNTVEEAMNACDPLAHILDMVLSGE